MLSIVVVNYRTEELLKLCLNSIKETYNKLNEYEVIVVDSGSTRKSKNIILELKNQIKNCKTIFREENLGFSRGVNLGIKESIGDYILVLNPDTVMTDGAVENMLSYISKHEDIGMLGPQMKYFNGEYQQTYFRFYTPLTILGRRTFFGKFNYFKKLTNFFLMKETNHNEIQTPDWLMGSAMMLNKKAIEKVGLMDERFFMYFEDVDWARRFWHNGYKVVYYPNVTIYHYHQRESKSRWGFLDIIINKKTRWHIKSAIKFFWKYRNLAKTK